MVMETKMVMETWYSKFWHEVRRNPWADGLKDAAINGKLKRWTELLTEVVAQTCQGLGLQVAAKGQMSPVLPVQRQEYLSVDILAFPQTNKPQWRKPVLALELENSQKTEIIAYALWKVCMVRVEWGGVFCYRKEPEAIGELLRELRESVMKYVEPDHGILLVVGTHSRTEDFPDGFFKPYVWDSRFRQFRPIP